MRLYNQEDNGGGQVLNLDLEDGTTTVVTPTEGANASKSAPFDYSAFREFDPEINENNYLDRIKSTFETRKQYEARIADLEVAAASMYDIDSDENIVRNRSLLQKPNEELVFNSFAYQYETVDGLSREEAIAKATEKVKDLKESSKYAIEDEARRVRTNIKSFTDSEITKKRSAISDARKKTLEATKPDASIKANTLAEFEKLDEVFGFKLDKKNEKFAEKFEKPVRQYIESGEIDKDWANPKTRLEFAIFQKQRSLIERNLRQPKSSAAALPAKQIPTGGPTQGAGAGGGEKGKLKMYPRGYVPPKD